MTGSRQSHLRCIVFFAAAVSALSAADVPYPRSPVVTRLTWERDVVRLGVNTDDNWPSTWGDDDVLYTSWGDGGGFTLKDPKLSLWLAKIAVNPSNLTA